MKSGIRRIVVKFSYLPAENIMYSNPDNSLLRNVVLDHGTVIKGIWIIFNQLKRIRNGRVRKIDTDALFKTDQIYAHQNIISA